MSTLLTSLVRVNAGGEQLAFVQSFDSVGLLSSGATSANNGFLALVRVAKPIKVSTIKIFVGTASGNVDAGVYSSDGTTATRLASAGSTAAAGANAIQTLALSTPVTLQPGVDYYLAFAPDNATVAIGRASATGAVVALGNRALTKATSFPLPASFTLASMAGTNFVPWLFGA